MLNLFTGETTFHYKNQSFSRTTTTLLSQFGFGKHVDNDLIFGIGHCFFQITEQEIVVFIKETFRNIECLNIIPAKKMKQTVTIRKKTKLKQNNTAAFEAG